MPKDQNTGQPQVISRRLKRNKALPEDTAFKTILVLKRASGT
jgi:hypothetical protein